MPTPTFLRLHPDKKERILQAAINEYARVPFNEVSIKNIVEGAGIPRGSFYAYFDGKEDLSDYLLKEYRDQFRAYAKEVFDQYNGDLFLSMNHLYQELLRQCLEAQNNYLKMIFLNMRSGVDGNVFEYYKTEGSEGFMEIVSKVVNTENLRLEREEDLHEMIELTIMLIRHQLSKAMRCEGDYDAACKQFAQKLEFLKRGMQRGETQ